MSLMDVLYKGYQVPKAKGKLVSFGMGFGNAAYVPKEPKTKLKYGMITEKVECVLASFDRWASVREVADITGLSSPSIRNAMVGLIEKGSVKTKLGTNGCRLYKKT